MLRTIRVDWGNDILYDKRTGELVAVLNWGIDPNRPDTCSGGPGDLPAPAVNLLAGCTTLGDSQSQADGGAAPDAP